MPGVSYTREELREPVQPTVLYWPEFQAMFLASHEQGEHVSIVGPTGSGKTMLGLNVCKLIGSRMASDRRPSRVVVLNTKVKDDTVRKVLPEESWPIIKQWPPSFGQEHCIVWPQGGAPSTRTRKQRDVFLPLLDKIFVEGGQTVYIPEAAYIERPLPKGLGMGGTMEQFWESARSNELTTVSDTQRPRHVTILMWSEPSWLMIYRPKYEDDLKHVAGLSGRKREVLAIVPKLGPREFLCVRDQRGGRPELYVSRVELDSSVTGDNSNNRNGRR